ncbi:MAG: hypothetical protein ABIG37_03825 [Nanoarchaeota archaeon]
MAELHSITGMFYEEFPGISPWGGYFIKGMDGEDSGIDGMLADTHGISRITGTMNSGLLEFIKQYEENMGQAFHYKFSLKDEIWLGEYTSSSSGYGGRSVCKTNLCIKDLTFRKFDTRTPEGFAKAIIGSMVEGGQLEKFKDPETGEEMIKAI